MKFSEIPYKRPSIVTYEKNYRQSLLLFEQAQTYKIQEEALLSLYKLSDSFNTMFQLASIRHRGDMNDRFLEEEARYFDTAMPIKEKLEGEFYTLLANAKFKEALSEKWGEHLFKLAELKVGTGNSEITADLIKENNLVSDYEKLKGSAKIEWNGEQLNLAGIAKFMVNPDRETRKKATAAYYGFFAKNQLEFDRIYDELVKIRHQIALKSGYDNFVDLGYVRMDRIDYNKEMIEDFRKNIVKYIVPINRKIRAAQKKRLDLKSLTECDIDLQFPSGNPSPKGDAMEILRQIKQLYEEMSEETGYFITHMAVHDLLDVENRVGKGDSGYSWELTDLKHPFISVNFNGTMEDIYILTHEIGHAFQYYRNRHRQIADYRWPSRETAEIPAMAMEFLTFPWMKRFFEEDTDKYFFAHLSKCMKILALGCLGDHFQHIVYENPHFTPDERAAAWKKLEATYLPDWEYDTSDYLKSGRYWQRQGHLFFRPFFLIDYVLAQICAFQFLLSNQRDKATTWDNFLKLVKVGGTKSFLEILETANIKSPFEKDTVKGIAGEIDDFLGSLLES